jgi:hypothetical protein
MAPRGPAPTASSKFRCSIEELWVHVNSIFQKGNDRAVPHRFKIGDVLFFRPKEVLNAARGTYTVTGLMPASDGSNMGAEPSGSGQGVPSEPAPPERSKLLDIFIIVPFPQFASASRRTACAAGVLERASRRVLLCEVLSEP